MQHSSGFLKLVEDARPRVKEVSLDEARERLRQNPRAVLLDVREDGEWQAGHAQEAQHLGKGILERDLEQRFPDPDTEIIMYCGGGYRSALTCDAAQKMGRISDGRKLRASRGMSERAGHLRRTPLRRRA